MPWCCFIVLTFYRQYGLIYWLKCVWGRNVCFASQVSPCVSVLLNVPLLSSLLLNFDPFTHFKITLLFPNRCPSPLFLILCYLSPNYPLVCLPPMSCLSFSSSPHLISLVPSLPFLLLLNGPFTNTLFPPFVFHRTTRGKQRCTVQLSTDTLRWYRCCFRSWRIPPWETAGRRHPWTWQRCTDGCRSVKIPYMFWIHLLLPVDNKARIKVWGTVKYPRHIRSSLHRQISRLL